MTPKLSCDTYDCVDRLWCLRRVMCKIDALRDEYEEPREEYPDNGPSDPHLTSGPKT